MVEKPILKRWNGCASGMLAIVLLLVSVTVSSDDGLVVQVTIHEETVDGTEGSRYTNALLMSFQETAVSTFPDQYEVKFQIDAPDKGKIDFVFTLKDLSSGKPYYVGAAPLSLRVGQSDEIRFDRNGRLYRVLLDTSYGVLP